MKLIFLCDKTWIENKSLRSAQQQEEFAPGCCICNSSQSFHSQNYDWRKNTFNGPSYFGRLKYIIQSNTRGLLQHAWERLLASTLSRSWKIGSRKRTQFELRALMLKFSLDTFVASYNQFKKIVITTRGFSTFMCSNFISDINMVKFDKSRNLLLHETRDF